MALLFMDSFDNYVSADLTEKWTNTGGSTTIGIDATHGRRGSGSFRCNTGFSTNSNFYVNKTLAPGDPTIVMGFSLVIPAGLMGTSGMAFASIREGSTPQITLALNQVYTLRAIRGTFTGTNLGTSTAALSAGVVAYIEVKITIHPSAGTVEIRVNGTPVLALTGQNTRNTANTSWDNFTLGQVDAVFNTIAGTNMNIDYDDLYVLDGTGSAPWNTFLGDCRVDARAPTAAGATTGWTPNTGANYAAVDDAVPDDDTTYTSAAAAGLTDTFVVQDAPVAGATIYGVQYCLNAKKTDAGSASIAPVARVSGVDYVGANINPGTSYAYLQQIAAVNPATAAQWTAAEFNAAEFGYKRTI